ncbi:hypothetical protein EJ08DRAFT_646737 [Tothia fuscella]|uniref:DUF7730 domain-containing protein n=1 Tax=Tothia fuscella TaxID=1048955 RepID=A0A9P4U153_9PEZI|nr:hypothetical protein EJ08DRAFT_646737 [Tothia fuscella]
MRAKRDSPAAPGDLMQPPSKHPHLAGNLAQTFVLGQSVLVDPFLDVANTNTSIVKPSPRFFTLPRELRDQVYKYLLTGRVIHFTETWWRCLSGFATKEAAQAAGVHPSIYELHACKPRLTPALLRVSHQMYNETADLMYTDNTFVGKLCSVDILPERLLTFAQFKSIRSLRLEVKLDRKISDLAGSYLQCFPALKHIHLDMVFYADHPDTCIDAMDHFKEHGRLPDEYTALTQSFGALYHHSATVTVEQAFDEIRWDLRGWGSSTEDEYQGAWQWSPEELVELGSRMEKEILGLVSDHEGEDEDERLEREKDEERTPLAEERKE